MENLSGDDLSKRLDHKNHFLWLGLFWADHCWRSINYLHAQNPDHPRDIQTPNLKSNDTQHMGSLFWLSKDFDSIRRSGMNRQVSLATPAFRGDGS